MTLLLLSCVCVIVLAWPVSCPPATRKHSTGTSLVCGEGSCVCNVTHADCSSRSLHYIPSLPPGITSLDFSWNEPRNTERADFFDNAAGVVWLSFKHNHKLNFSSSTFERLTRLTFLDLTSSSMPCSSMSSVLQIPSLEFLRLNNVYRCAGLELLNITSPIPNLQELDLSAIHICPYLNLSYLSPFTGLRRLTIGGACEGGPKMLMSSPLHMMSLTYINMTFSCLSCKLVANLLATPSLQELRLVKGTVCHEFNFTLQDRRTNLTRLDLSENKIYAISRFSLPVGLKHLNLSFNRISDMTFVSGLSSLRVLDMRGNGLLGYFEICLPHLQQFDLSDNGLDADSFSFINSSCLTNVITLNLHANRFQLPSLKTMFTKLSCFQNLEVLDLSEQHQGSIEYKRGHTFRNVRLTLLNLADNHIHFHNNHTVSADTFLGYPNLEKLLLVNNDLGAVNEERFLQLFGHLVHLQQLSLRSTGLRFISSAMFRQFRALRSIDLSQNRLFTVPDAVLESALHLRMLNLSCNRITVIEETTFSHAMRHRLQHMDLSDNPFTCSCEVLWFRSWLLSSPSLFANSSSNYLCANLPDIPIISFSMTEQACLLSQQTSKFIIATVSLIFLGLSSLTFVYRYRWHIRLVLHEVFRGNDDRARHLRQNRFQYDVFVCHDSDDFAWVHDHLMPSLEEGMELKLCIHQRDFIPGTPIVDNIQDSVVASKKMLMVFSRQFAQSPWCQFELQLCLTHAMDTQDVLIVVLLEDIPRRELTSSMMAVMKTTTYIEWADKAEARDCFWRRLMLALHEVLPGARV